MTILIEDAESLEFFGDDGQWTKNAEDGKSFESARSAYAAAKKEPIRKFNIVRYFAQNGQFVNMDHGSGSAKGKETETA